MLKLSTAVGLIVILAPPAFSQGLCRQVHQQVTDRAGFVGQFLLQRDQRLHVNPIVERVTHRTQALSGSKLQSPVSRVQAWIDYLTQFTNRAQRSERSLSLLKESLYNTYVIKPEDVPQSYFDFQVRLARERGHGDITLDQKQKQALIDNIIKDQKSSLDTWTEYLVSPDTAMYPMWIKHWMFTGMSKLSKYDIDKGTFGNRDKGTVAPFPELNREALALSVDMILKHLNKNDLGDLNSPEIQAAVQSLNFGRIYGQVLFRLGVGREGQFKTNQGRWVIYPKGSDHMPLFKSLEGKNTGWCTAAEATAKKHLEAGDFHVYYSLDDAGQPTVPRVAVRMEGTEIAEVRGVATEQNLDPKIIQGEVVSNKMKEFGTRGEVYLQKDADMKQLTEIDRRYQRGLELTKEDLRFLYEVDRNIQGFGYNKDPRIDAVLKNRNWKRDIVFIFDGKYKEEEISNSPEDIMASSGKIKVFRGDIKSFSPKMKEGVILPEVVLGDIDLSSLRRSGISRYSGPEGSYPVILGSLESLTLPQYWTGTLKLPATELHRILRGFKGREDLLRKIVLWDSTIMRSLHYQDGSFRTL